MALEVNKQLRVSRPASRVPDLPTVSFATLGCKTNQFETASMRDILGNAGYRVVTFEEAADLVIVNTCTVTNATDARSRNLIRRARRLNPQCRVIVTGCYAQVEPESLQDLAGVNLVIGNEEKSRLLDYLQEDSNDTRVEVSDIRESSSVCLTPLTTFSGRSRAFVQIQNGCDAFCSYCIIPYARGTSRSADAADIISQIKTLVATGFHEVVLTGIHIGCYGLDSKPRSTLKELLQRIECETDLHRLRLGSIEPTELTDDLLYFVSHSKIACHHFHVPLQSGCDAVLGRMGRTYDTDEFAALIHKVRGLFPDAAICLDVITGFPGETDDEAGETYRFIDSLPVTDLHVFPFSRRPGTPAAAMEHQVNGDVSKTRAKELRRLAGEKNSAFADRFIDRTLDVIVEQAHKNGALKGVSRNYLDVHVPGSEDFAGACLDVKVVGRENGQLVGEILRDIPLGKKNI